MTSDQTVSGIILAAGKGTRMKSSLPKVLHPVAGSPMLSWVISAVEDAGVKDITLVLNPNVEKFSDFLDEYPELRVVIQQTQQGTGDAVASAAPAFAGVEMPAYSQGKLWRGESKKTEWVLVVTGDTPAISPRTLKSFLDAVLNSKKKLGVLGMHVSDPRGYGRLICNSERGLIKNVEERDADSETKKIKLCNSGVMAAQVDYLFELLGKIAPHNAQNEYYLTDVFSMSAAQKHYAHVFETTSDFEFAGINDRVQLQAMEAWLLDSRRNELMLSGVTLHCPQTIYVERDVVIEQDVELQPGVCVYGNSRIGRNCVIGAGSIITDSEIGAGANIGAKCVLTGVKIKAGDKIFSGSARLCE